MPGISQRLIRLSKDLKCLRAILRDPSQAALYPNRKLRDSEEDHLARRSGRLRMDGSGYPRKLKGEEICMEARILAVADVVESMASHRPYCPALGIDAALAEIEMNKLILYDSGVVETCIKIFRENDYQFEGLAVGAS